MFYCKDCREKNAWPEGLGRSYGRCEVCGKTAECSDVPSKYLPEAPKKAEDPENDLASQVRYLEWEEIETVLLRNGTSFSDADMIRGVVDAYGNVSIEDWVKTPGTSLDITIRADRGGYTASTRLMSRTEAGRGQFPKEDT